ncbi:MAG: ABC transporter ATP-binding protein [Bacilli bacterium]|nr:ABC transporter ATP-binding protein [Bacilli bacterium]
MLFGKYINKYYKKYWYLFLIGIVTLVAVDYVQSLLPEALGNIVNMFQGGSPEEKAVMDITFNVIGMAFAMAIGRALWRIVIFNASSRIEMGLRDTMFRKSARLSQTYLHKNPVGTILNWFSTDIEAIGELTGFGTVMLVDAVFMSVLVIFKMFFLNWFVSIIILAPMLLVVVWGSLVEKFMSKVWDQRQKSNDELYDFSQENFTGIRVIKAFVKEKQQLHAFAKVARKNKDVNVKFARLSVFFDVCIELLIGLIFGIALALGGYLVWRSFNGEPLFGLDLNAGQLTEIISYFAMLIWPMIALGQIFAMLSRAKASLRRITTFLDSEEDIKNPENAVVLENVKGKIEFRDFTFRYPDSEFDSISNLTLTINPGETIGVVGKIGSGKSTLVNAIARLYNVEEGTVFVDDVDIMHADIGSLRDSIGYVPQDNFLFSDEIANNIAFAENGIPTMDRIQEAASFANVHDDINSFPGQYKTVSGERGVTLSGGQKQRISIARAYYKDAPILILDDSVSAVDTKTEEGILKNIREKRAGKTTILIASRVSTVSKLDRILVLNEGKLEAFGTHAELMKSSPTYSKMVMLQELEGVKEE